MAWVSSTAVVSGPRIQQAADPTPFFEAAQFEDPEEGSASFYDSPLPADVSTFSTSFPLTENPISQGGAWTCGRAVGLDWNSPQSFAGIGAGPGAATSVSFDDSIAHLSGFAADHYAQGTIYNTFSDGNGHETELLLRFQITAHNARGYEIYWSSNQGINIVRWNGAIGDFTLLTSVGSFVPTTGRVLKATIVGSLITVYVDGVSVLTWSDSTWTTGQPGMGFGPYPGVVVLNTFGWSAYSAGNL